MVDHNMTEKQPIIPPKSAPIDKAGRAVVRGLAGALPFVGSAIAEAIEVVYKLEGNSIAKQKNNNGSAKPIAVNASNESEEDNGLLPCPQCGEKTLRPEGRCFTCSNCLWTKCD